MKKFPSRTTLFLKTRDIDLNVSTNLFVIIGYSRESLANGAKLRGFSVYISVSDKKLFSFPF